MSDSISGVIIPLIIPVDAPPSLASGVQALAASLETTEFSNACLQLQQSFCYLTWHFADYSARHLQQLGLEFTACSAFGHSRLDQHLQALHDNLERLAEAAEKHPEVGDVFRVFYVGGLRARHSSPRRHTRLLGLGGQSIRGYRSVLEWCRLELGDEEFSGELRCQRELRRYLPILREWLDSSSGHFRQVKTYNWFEVASTDPPEEGEAPASPPPAATAPSEALASLKSPVSEAPAVVSLNSFPTPPLLARHQALFEEQAAAQDPAAFVTLGRLAGLAVQYLFAISGAALRAIGQLDPALEKRMETGLTLRQKQTSLTFLFKGLAQHQHENPMLEQVARAVQAPTGGKLADFLTSTWGGGHTFAEFCMETAKPDPPPLWQERFLPGIRAWLQQSASWFAHAEHYFQPPNEQGFVSFTLQLGDEHLEVDRKALQLDTAALRIGAAELKQLLTAREVSGESTAAVDEPAKAEPAKVEPAKAEPVKAEPAKAEPAKAEPAQVSPAKAEPAKAEPAKAEPAEVRSAKAEPAKSEPAKTEPAQADAAKTRPAKAGPAKVKPAETEPTKAEPAGTEPTQAEPAEVESAKIKPAETETAKAEPAGTEPTQAEPAEVESAKIKPAETETAKADSATADPAQAKPAEVESAKIKPAETETAKADSATADPAQAEPAEVESAKAEPAETEPTKAEPAEVESAKAEPAETEPAEVESVEVESAKVESAKAEPAETEPAEVESAEVESAEVPPAVVEPAKAEPPETEPAEVESAKAEPTQAEPAEVESAKAEPATTEPAKAETARTEPAKAEPAEVRSAKAEPAEAEAADAEPAQKEPAEVVGTMPTPSAPEGKSAEPAVAEISSPLIQTNLQTASALDWAGPAIALELWDKSIEARQPEPLLTLVSFLIQYTSGITAEWRELEDKAAPPSITSALDQLLERLQTEDDTPVLSPLGSATDPQSLHHWLRQPELRSWLSEQRDDRPEIQQQAGAWLGALQPFFKDSEQLFEEPMEGGKLEGVVVYQERFLEFVDHPIYVGPIDGAFWQTAAATGTDRPDPVELPVETAAVAETIAPPDFAALPACATEYYENLWTADPVSLEGLAAALEFSIQYYAGLLASVAISAEATEASHLSAWRGDSNLLQRLEMIQQILDETRTSEHPTLASLRDLFEGAVFGEIWKRERSELASLAYALRCDHQEEHERASILLATWIEAARPLLGTLENLAEPIDAKGHLEVVVQQDDNFFELVEPEYAIHLVPPGFLGWQDLICYRNLAARYGSQELLGTSDGSQELSGSAVTDDSEDFFSAPSLSLQDKMMEALFKAPEPAPPTAKLEAPKPKPQLVQQEEQPVVATPRSELQMNAVLEQLLQKPADDPPPPATTGEEGTAAVTAKLEPPKRLDAPVAAEKQPEFIVVDPPKLQYTIHYDGKEGQIHNGRIELKNVGGSLLKGTVKSNHPCLRVNPSVFRTNEAEINYWIDDSDRPSNMQKIGLSFHFSGQKVEVPMEKMLPDKKFKQLASKMLGFVKNLRQKG